LTPQWHDFKPGGTLVASVAQEGSLRERKEKPAG
jgi:acyl-CoA thioesterase